MVGALSHVKSNPIPDFTGTFTGFNSQGSTTTIAASNVVRPSDWNSAHNVFLTLSGNTAGQSTVSGTNIVLEGGSNITLSAITAAGGATIQLQGPNPPNRSFQEIMQGERFTTAMALSATQITNRPVFMPFWMDGTGLQLNTMRFIMSYAGSSNRSLGGTFNAGIYRAVNSTQLSLLASDSVSYSITASSQSSAYNGAGPLDFTGMSTHTFTQEGRYVVGFMIEPVSANATWMAASLYGADVFPVLSRHFIANTTSATASNSNVFPFWGAYSTTTGVLPGTVHATQINGGNSASLVDLYVVLKEI